MLYNSTRDSGAAVSAAEAGPVTAVPQSSAADRNTDKNLRIFI